MKRLLTVLTLTFCSLLIIANADAQERYGKALNLGLGVGGYGGYSKYATRAVPVITINYEFDVARNFTLAPSVGFYGYSETYYWSNDHYTYSATVVPVTVKGTYYFDELLEANQDWDFYAAASLGFAIVNSRWDNGYDGDKNHFNRANPMLFDLHIGAEYHISGKTGIFLDLSSGVSTLGIAFHPSR